jgi:hypothetical protein
MTLLEPAGPFQVGMTTFSHSVPRQIFGSSKLPNGEPALVMEEVLYNVYYPADTSTEGTSAYAKVPWLIRYVTD